MRPPRRCGTGSQVSHRFRNAESHRHVPNLYRSRKTNKQQSIAALSPNAPRAEPPRPRTRLVYCQAATVLLTGNVAHVLSSRPRSRPVPLLRIAVVTTFVSSGAVACSDARALSFAACDGEISRQEMVMIDAHLQQCVACRLRFAGDAVFRRALRAAGSLNAATPRLRDRIAQLLLLHAPENAST